jgi:tetratricopeptide (TPR) repeat protein
MLKKELDQTLKMSKKFASGLTNISLSLKNFTKESIQDFIINLQKLKKLKATNIDLGRYHLNEGRITDALFRFNLIKYLWRDDQEIMKYLGIAYLLKEEYEKARYYFNACEKSEQLELNYYQKLAFSPSLVEDIPRVAKNRQDKMRNHEYLIQLDLQDCILIKEVMGDVISKHLSIKLPYNVLEIYPEDGEIGKLLKSFFPSLEIYGVTDLQKTKDYCSEIVVEGEKIYKKIYQEDIGEFFRHFDIKFNLVIGLFSFNDQRNLLHLERAYSALIKEGVAIFAFPICEFEDVVFDIKNEYFKYKEIFLKDKLEKADFSVKEIIKLELSYENILFFICNKI